MTASATPIGPYLEAPAECLDYDPRAPEVAAAVCERILSARPGLRIEHVGSTELACRFVVARFIAEATDYGDPFFHRARRHRIHCLAFRRGAFGERRSGACR